jgi:hypothetical protein
MRPSRHVRGSRSPRKGLRPLRRSRQFLFVLALPAWLLAMTLAAPARAAWMIPPDGIRPKDFTLLKRDGLYHLFYIRRDTNLPFEQTEYDFGHAISPDLFAWSQLPPVLAARDTSWDRDHVWAPSIVYRDSVYYLFYTGVMDEPGSYATFQRIGVATSSDLLQWNRMDSPVLTCASIPWVLCDSLSSAAAFRDPFVMADPTTPGRWLMYYSTAPASDPGGMMVGVAASSGDFTQWNDLKPLWITQRAYTFNSVVESPHVFKHAGLWYLFYTTSAGQPLTFATSPNPLSDPGGWTYRGRLGTMLSVDTQGWFASEQFSDGAVDYFAFVNGDRIDIQRMGWYPDWRFLLAQPELFHVQHMRWSSPIIRAGQGITLSIESTWGFGRTVQVDAYEVDADGSQELIPPNMIGLPYQLSISGPITTFNWVAHDWPDGTDDGPGAEIVFRLRDRTCETVPLTVLPGSIGDPYGDPPPEPEPAPDVNAFEDVDHPVAGSLEPRLRLLTRGPYGNEPALLAELPVETPARLDIYDLQGRRVRSIADRMLPPGASVLPWDRRDAAGALVPNGVYFARLTTPRSTRTARVVVIR